MECKEDVTSKLILNTLQVLTKLQKHTNTCNAYSEEDKKNIGEVISYLKTLVTGIKSDYHNTILKRAKMLFPKGKPDSVRAWHTIRKSDGGKAFKIDLEKELSTVNQIIGECPLCGEKRGIKNLKRHIVNLYCPFERVKIPEPEARMEKEDEMIDIDLETCNRKVNTEGDTFSLLEVLKEQLKDDTTKIDELMAIAKEFESKMGYPYGQIAKDDLQAKEILHNCCDSNTASNCLQFASKLKALIPQRPIEQIIKERTAFEELYQKVLEVKDEHTASLEKMLDCLKLSEDARKALFVILNWANYSHLSEGDKLMLIKYTTYLQESTRKQPKDLKQSLCWIFSRDEGSLWNSLQVKCSTNLSSYARIKEIPVNETDDKPIDCSALNSDFVNAININTATIASELKKCAALQLFVGWLKISNDSLVVDAARSVMFNSECKMAIDGIRRKEKILEEKKCEQNVQKRGQNAFIEEVKKQKVIDAINFACNEIFARLKTETEELKKLLAAGKYKHMLNSKFRLVCFLCIYIMQCLDGNRGQNYKLLCWMNLKSAKQTESKDFVMVNLQLFNNSELTLEEQKPFKLKNGKIFNQVSLPNSVYNYLVNEFLPVRESYLESTSKILKVDYSQNQWNWGALFLDSARSRKNSKNENVLVTKPIDSTQARSRILSLGFEKDQILAAGDFRDLQGTFNEIAGGSHLLQHGHSASTYKEFYKTNHENLILEDIDKRQNVAKEHGVVFNKETLKVDTGALNKELIQDIIKNLQELKLRKGMDVRTVTNVRRNDEFNIAFVKAVHSCISPKHTLLFLDDRKKLYAPDIMEFISNPNFPDLQKQAAYTFGIFRKPRRDKNGKTALALLCSNSTKQLCRRKGCQFFHNNVSIS